jgi:hypothetical protein
MTRAERFAQVQALRKSGLTSRQIATRTERAIPGDMQDVWYENRRERRVQGDAELLPPLQLGVTRTSGEGHLLDPRQAHRGDPPLGGVVRGTASNA